MTEKTDGGPAFPIKAVQRMSLRDWFAGMALNGLLASGIDKCVHETVARGGDEARAMSAFCATCFDWADAMLDAREAR